MIQEYFMLFGCPHCGDGVPAIVAMRTTEKPGSAHLICDPDDPLAVEIEKAYRKYPFMSIISCRKLGDE